jgi:EpsI family protein
MTSGFSYDNGTIMSVAERTRQEQGFATPAGTAPARGALWVRVALVCALLAASGGIRWWQMRRVHASLERGKQSPFPLHELPLTLGSWQGQDARLDPQIARMTGSTDHLFRRYVNHDTGVVLEIYILYGPAAEMFIHMPENCYPRAGYLQVEGPDERTIAVGRLRVPFRALVYNKGEGGQADREEVYYTWRYNDRWTPQVGIQKKFERIPGMYKVHVARRVTARERRDIGNPCEDFLSALLPEIERRVSAIAPSAPATS